MKKLIPFLFIALFAISFTACHNKRQSVIEQNFTFAAKQIEYAISQIEPTKADESAESREKREEHGWGELVSPRTFQDGKLSLVTSMDWTSGFFPGELWYMYEYTGDPKWKAEASKFTAPIEREKLNGGTHDMGFKVYCSFGNGYRLNGDENYRDIMVEAAYTLITRYKSAAKVIRSWDHNRKNWQSPVIIDNMMNLELLFWAFRETGDSSFYNIAVNHAVTTMQNHFREDNSSYHVIDYDTISGQVLKRNTHQGYSHESAWSRGQAWGIYGYTMCYRETGKREFLDQAERIASYIFNNPALPEDLIPYWDFNAPNIPNEPRDVSAATITASALYELSTYNTDRSAQYLQWANTIIDNLSAHYLANEGAEGGFLLLHSTGSKAHNSEVDVPLVYADYYYLEALLRKQKLESNRIVE